MSVRHHSTDVAPDQVPVSDIMGSRETTLGVTRVAPQGRLESDVVVSRASSGAHVCKFPRCAVVSVGGNCSLRRPNVRFLGRWHIVLDLE
jgi:hypothetical protein